MTGDEIDRVPVVCRVDRMVWKALVEEHRRLKSHVPTVILQTRIPKHDRQLREWLTRLERLGYVERRGMRGGWRPVDPTASRIRQLRLM